MKTLLGVLALVSLCSSAIAATLNDPASYGGGWGPWGPYCECTKTCGGGTQYRLRVCANPPVYGKVPPCVGSDKETRDCNTNHCEINGGYSNWSKWGKCNKSCGKGYCTRTRTCTSPPPQYGGKNCNGYGASKETKVCSAHPCPVDGYCDAYGSWSKCSKTCGGGYCTQTRKCYPPKYGGKAYKGPISQTKKCGTHPCPVDGYCDAYGSWSKCSKTCGGGYCTQTRKCYPPKYGGKAYKGPISQTKKCGTHPCPVDGYCDAYGSWSKCSKTCGGGYCTQTRKCYPPKYGGKAYKGPKSQTKKCGTHPCPVDGYCDAYGSWSKCSKTCGGGYCTQTRKCYPPKYGGKAYKGPISQTKKCGTHPCPVDGYCDAYGSWSKCSKTCGGGYCTQTRKCYPPKYGGKAYKGPISQTKKCGTHPCPVDGYCDAYGSWSKCSKTCGGGYCTQTRKCYPPKYGGKAYKGPISQTKKCGTHPCPVDGYCDAYGSWSKCSKTCGGGYCTQTRKCYPPKYGGKPYKGPISQTKKCGTHPCPVDGYCDAYGSWSKCSKTCGGGYCTQTRKCYPPKYGGKPYKGPISQTKKCGTHPCPVDGYCDAYGSWSKCSKTCGGGYCTQTRKCYPPKYGGKPYKGPISQTKKCGTHPCPVDGYCDAYGSWSKCSKTCGGGYCTQTRKCYPPKYGGKAYKGPINQTKKCGTHPCPVDGYCDAYGSWSKCSKTCGGGYCTQTRKCYPPKYGGKAYKGPINQTKKCGTHPCPVDGYCDAYGSWSKCSKTCGGGYCTQTRKCYPPKYGGKAYKGPINQTKKCGTHPCPVDGYCDAYGSWSKCSKTCGGGYCTQTRKCYPPKYGGKAYKGPISQTKKCGTHPCPVDGYCDAYGSWSKCSKTCGGGYCTQTRKCYPPKYGGKPYKGPISQTKKCGTHPCPVDGYCDAYGSWSKCSKTCGGGYCTQTRKCYPPKYGGKAYKGPISQTKKCGTRPCPVDGYCDAYGSWSKCSKTCGGGYCTQTRKCYPPKYGGKAYKGPISQTKKCGTHPCPVDGYCDAYGSWSKCSKTCGGGYCTQTRKCYPPKYGGKAYKGPISQTKKCGTHPCPVDGYCDAYGSWSKCSKTCGGGYCTQTRKCYPPKYGGKAYKGPISQTKKCGTHPCPVDGYCDAYGSWSKCSKTCGGGYCTQTRKCYPPKYGGKAYKGPISQTKKCGTHPCPVDGYCDAYGSWSKCSKTCGGGYCTQTRKCYPPKYGGKAYKGPISQTKKCGSHPCPVDGYCDAYGSWSKCSKTCGGGYCTQKRTCYPPKYGGKPYKGPISQTKKCGTHPCPVDGYCDPYGSWSACSRTCGGGYTTRTRKCYQPKYGGRPCPPIKEESKKCGTHPCPVDGGYNSWCPWSTCTRTCGRGFSTRSRECINPRPQYGGKPCQGQAKETTTCYIKPCKYGSPY